MGYGSCTGLGGWCGGSRACSGCCGGWGSGRHLGLEPGWEGGPLEEGRHCVSLHAALSASAAGLLYFSQRKGIFPSERGGHWVLIPKKIGYILEGLLVAISD